MSKTIDEKKQPRAKRAMKGSIMTKIDETVCHQQNLPWSKDEGPDPAEKLLTIQETAAYLGVSGQTLGKWRKEGTGPPFVRLGSGPRAPIRYRLSDVHAWIENHTEQGAA